MSLAVATPARPRTSFVPQVPRPKDAQAATFGVGQSVDDPNHWLMRAIGGGPTKAGPSVSEYTAHNLPVVYACVNRIANPIGYFPLKIYKGNQVEVTDHPLSTKLGLRPNPFMSSRTVRKTMQRHALLWGNGYCEIERNGRGQAVGLWPLLPDRTRPEKKDDRLVYRTTINGTQFVLDHDDVIHAMDQSQDGYIGQSQIAVARQAIGLGLAMEEFGSKFFANDARSGGFLYHPNKLSQQARENLRDSAEKQGGLDNAHRIKVLDEGMKFEAVTIPPEDAQFLGSRSFQTEEIARIYDVPLVLLQSHEKTTSWGTGIEQLMIGFVRQTIVPWTDAWEQELNWKLFTPSEISQGYYVKFNINALLRGDMTARAAFYQSGIITGWMKKSEARSFEEMVPWEGVDDKPTPPAPTTPPNVTQERTRE